MQTLSVINLVISYGFLSNFSVYSFNVNICSMSGVVTVYICI